MLLTPRPTVGPVTVVRIGDATTVFFIFALELPPIMWGIYRTGFCQVGLMGAGSNTFNVSVPVFITAFLRLVGCTVLFPEVYVAYVPSESYFASSKFIPYAVFRCLSIVVNVYVEPGCLFA